MKCCESICKTVLGGRGDWKTGKTKMFLKVLPDLSVLDVLGLFQRMKGGKSKNNSCYRTSHANKDTAVEKVD